MSIFNNKNSNKIEENQEKRPLLEENKTLFERIMHFFSYTFKYALLSPWQKRIAAMFGRSNP
jgi:hypothetical protein